MSDDYGPRWCVNSEEVGAGILFYLIIGVIAFSVLPMFFLGYLLVSKIWDVKIFKYPMAFMLACAHGMGVYILYGYSKTLALGLVLLTWLVLDYVLAHRTIKQMWLIRTTQRLLRWLFSK